MKLFFVKAGILLLCFFFNFFWSCEDIIHYNKYQKIEKVRINGNGEQDWNNYRLEVIIEGEYTRTEHASAQVNFGVQSCLAKTDAWDKTYLEKTITDYQIRVIPSNVILTDQLLNSIGMFFSDYVNKINEGVENLEENYIRNIETHGVGGYRYSESFRFKKKPTELKDKNFQIVVWLKTEDGKEFSDTTEVVRLTL